MPELVICVIEPRDEKRDEFDPHPEAIQATDRVQDRCQPPDEFPVVTVIETLQIYLVKIDPRSEILEHARGRVSVGNKRCL